MNRDSQAAGSQSAPLATELGCTVTNPSTPNWSSSGRLPQRNDASAMPQASDRSGPRAPSQARCRPDDDSYPYLPATLRNAVTGRSRYTLDVGVVRANAIGPTGLGNGHGRLTCSNTC